ncbi:MAG: hypothetical protein H6567_01560 [Lewinellaceae bacterium]|nr:hypothetical protein [Lewinellaceae bacterium]
MTVLNETLYQIPSNPPNIGSGMVKKVKILIVIRKEDFGETEMETLRKIISSIQMDLDKDVHICYLEHGQKYSLSQFGIKYENLISFGIDAESLGFFVHITLNNLVNFHETKALFCESIREIKATPSKTKSLWVLLQAMFLK